MEGSRSKQVLICCAIVVNNYWKDWTEKRQTVYRVSSQNQIPLDLSCLSQRKIAYRKNWEQIVHTGYCNDQQDWMHLSYRKFASHNTKRTYDFHNRAFFIQMLLHLRRSSYTCMIRSLLQVFHLKTQDVILIILILELV